MIAFILLFGITFVLHLLWESAHLKLYRDYESMKGFFPVPVLAAIGDAAYTLVAVLLIGLFKGQVMWFEAATATDYLGLAILGACVALFVEYKAFTFKKWSYAPSMPVLPLLDVGLSSMIQKPLLFPLSVYLTHFTLTMIS